MGFFLFSALSWSQCATPTIGVDGHTICNDAVLAVTKPQTPTGKVLRDDNTWQTAGGQPGGLPTGLIVMLLSGSCPSGFTEATALNGKFLQGTLAANGDVGTAGGNATITPTGSVAAAVFTGDSTTVPAETVNSLTAGAQGFTGDSTTIPAETVAALTAAAQGFSGDVTTVPALAFGTLAASQAADTFGTTKMTTSGSGTAAFTSETARGAITVSGSTAAGSLTPLGHNATSAVTGTLNSTTVTPLGHNAASAVTGTLNSTTITPLGHNSAPAFAGDSVDPRPLYTKVIFCASN